MSNYPSSYDDDVSLPVVNDNITEIGGAAIDALRDAVFNIEQYVGTTDGYNTLSITDRLGVSINLDGTLNASQIASMGLVTLPITQDQIASNAAIPESKLALLYSTATLFGQITDLSRSVNSALGWIATTGIQLEPHLLGIPDFRHSLDQIDVSHDLADFPYLQNKYGTIRGLTSNSPNGPGYRDNTNSYNLINDLNNEFLSHQWADGTVSGTQGTITTNNGSSYSSNFAHTASGIFIDPTRFETIPQTNNNLQLFADYMDSSSLISLGSRTQNLFANGISVNSRSTSLTADGYGQLIVPPTQAIAYLKGSSGNLGYPNDDINFGDDIIQFTPTDGYSFDEQFSLVKVGDIVTINYGADGYGVEIQFVISEKKYDPGTTYIVRIAGKNIAYANPAVASITRSLFNNNKYGVLAAATGVTSDSLGNSLTGVTPSLIIGSPSGAQCLGIGFTPDEFNETHYLLYLALYPDGNPLDGYTVLPAIDVTGNSGTTPGAYTLESIVAATNNAFRKPGFNYRFIAFSYKGEFGIMLADSYNNAAFSVVNGVVDPTGFYDQTATQNQFPNNVIDLFPTTGVVAPDPLGFGPFGANVSSPLFQTSYGSAVAAEVSTKVFVPLNRNSYYVNGTEQDLLNLDVGQALDAFGDGYWLASIIEVSPVYGPPGYVNVKYQIAQDLSTSGLKPGKTLVVQPTDGYSGAAGINYGRFVITGVEFTCNPIQTVITVYDGVHAAGGTPVAVAPIGTQVSIYFGSDSVSFDANTATDFGVPIGAQFKRHFEIYVDQNSDTFTHERGRFNPAGPIQVNGITLANTLTIAKAMDIISISPKLRGYLFGSVTKITLSINSFNSLTGIFDGYLSSYDGYSPTSFFTRFGPTVSGKLGEVTRFYDETNTDYIDVLFSLSSTLQAITSQQYIDIQLFPTLSLDETIMLIGSCQVNNSNDSVTHIKDQREFGNTSEEQFTTSAINYISAPDRLLHFNGVIRGFDIAGTTNEFISVSGGLALVNGNLTYIDDQIITIPKIVEVVSGSLTSITYPINFALCVNSVSEIVAQPITDFDPILGTPTTGDRVMTVTNVVSGNSYVIDSNLFSYILNNRKDLTPLYVVSSTVSGTGTTATVSLSLRDVRRSAKDSDSVTPAVLTNDHSQGNFTSLSTALNWLKLNSSFQDELQVKGSFSIGYDPGLDFPLDIIGIGSASELTFSMPISIFSSSPINFSNIEATFAAGSSIENTNFNDCIINFGVTSVDGVIFTNSVINVGGLITNGIAGLQTQFIGCTINVSIAQAFAIGSNISFDNCTFNYTYNPVGSSAYSTSDLVNAGSGLMYANITGALNNVSVTNCTFNNSIADHFPFISLQLGGTSIAGFSYGAIAQNITISNNTFNCQQVTDDRRAVIAFTSTITASNSGVSFPPFPKLVNVEISENTCNYDQMILISTVRTAGHPITGAMLTCVDCDVSENTCGVIAYITSADIVSSDDNSVTSRGLAVRDKSDQLVIENNSCKLITNLDSVGQYIAFHAFEGGNETSDHDNDWVKVGTGAVSILRNTCNWVLVGTAVWSSGNTNGNINFDGAVIDENRCSPGNPLFLLAYQDVSNSGLPLPSIGILLRNEASAQYDYANSQSVISSNVLNIKNLLSQSNGAINQAYSFGIACYASAVITNNTISNVCSSSSSALVYLDGSAIGGPSIICNDNLLTRGQFTVGAYVQGGSTVASNLVSITNNIFDSPYVDTANTNTNTGIDIGANWVFVDNINQQLENISAGGLNFVDARSIEFISQSAQLFESDDVNCLYVLNGVLGFNDGGRIFHAISFSGGPTASPLNYTQQNVSTNLAIPTNAAYNWLEVDTTSGPITVTLPSISLITPTPAGRFFYFNDAAGQFGTNNLTISVAGVGGNLLYFGGSNQSGGTKAINWIGASGLIYTDGNNTWYVIPFNQQGTSGASVTYTASTVNFIESSLNMDCASSFGLPGTIENNNHGCTPQLICPVNINPGATSNGNLNCNVANAITVSAAYAINSSVSAGIIATNAGAIQSQVLRGINTSVAGGISSGITAGIHVDATAGIVSTTGSGGFGLGGGNSDYPIFTDATGSANPRTRIIAFPLTPVNITGASSDNYSFLMPGWSAQTIPAVNLIDPTDAPVAITPCFIGPGPGAGTAFPQYFSLPIVHNGATLNSVSVYFSVNGSRSVLPATLPIIRVYTASVIPGATNSYLSTTSAQTISPSSGSAYYNSGVAQPLTYTCNQNNVIDSTKNLYFITITDETGTNSQSGNKYYSVQLNYTVSNMAFST
jgi:hypothetical protein